MYCPACDQPLEADVSACPRCGFTHSLAGATFGQPPMIVAPITDPDQHLGAVAKRRLNAAILAFGKRFPQLKLTVAILEKPPAFAPKPYLFWLFNCSPTHTAMEKGGNNRQLLLWIDPCDRTAMLTVGYGLEPLIVPEVHLTTSLKAGESQLRIGQIGLAALAIVVKLNEQFNELADYLSIAFGWAPDDQWQSMDDDEAVLTLNPGSDQMLSY